MDTKFSLQDLATQLELISGLEPHQAQAFVKAFWEHVVHGLETDKYVKVKGLGTFKLVEVDSRESVNVNTGERFVIDGHARITFLPDNGLKDQVNKPFAHFDTVTLDDDVSEDELNEIDERFKSQELILDADEAVESEVSIETDTPEVSIQPEPQVVEERVEIHSEPAEPEIPEPVVEPSELAVEPSEPAVEPSEPVCLESVIPTPDKEEVVPAEPTEKQLPEGPVLVRVVAPVQVDVAAEHTVGSEPEQPVNPPHAEKHFHSLWTMLCLVALLVGYLLGFFRVLPPMGNWSPAVIHDTIVMKKVVHDTIRVQSIKPDSIQPSKESSKESKSAQPAAPKNNSGKSASQQSTSQPVSSDIPQVKGGAYVMVGTQSTYTMRPGETIRIIAERYYGSRQMALYISTYNRIDDPDKVAVGTVLKIPELKLKQK